MRRHSRLPRPFDSTPFTRAAGLARSLTDGRLREGDLDHPYHGVITAIAPTTLRERCAAFQVRMPTGAFYSHITAARLYGAPLAARFENETLLHVSRPARALTAAGIVGHHVRLIGDDWRDYLALRVSSPARTFCDLASMLIIPDLVAVGDHLIHWRLPYCSRAELGRAAELYPGRRGRPRLLAALALLDDRAESRRESILRVILRDGGLTGFRSNVWITTPGKNYRADFADPVLKIALEYQSNYHADIKQFRADMTRKSRLRAEGWLVIEINADDLDNPAELVARIRSHIREWQHLVAQSRR